MVSSLTSGQALDLSGFDVPGRGRGILDVFTRKYLLHLLIRKGTATRYRNSVLGWVWSYVKPAAQFVIYYFVMGVIMQMDRGIENFPVYLFSGVVAVNLFNEAFGNATTSIVDNRALVKKIYLPRELFPIAAIIIAFIHFLPQLAILLLVCLLMGWAPTLVGVAGLLLGVALVLSFALGLGLLFAGLNVRYRDAQNFVELIRMFSTWTSPVLYPWILVREAFPDNDILFSIYTWNPLTVAVELFHQAFWGATIEGPAPGDPDPSIIPDFGLAVLIATIVCIVTVIIGQTVFRHYERSFAQDL
ncbi:ABC transporter permease [Microbacterium esteraromaticum]|uniref:ABC transporter permease n=1 Tax=Microbacterium esteraromaticum TaxID=57043 RepID=UPI00309FAC7A